MLGKHELHKLYITEKRSWYEISRLTKIPESTLRFYAKKYDIRSRTKSEAQIVFLESAPHQRFGSTHSKESIEQIAQTVSDGWKKRKHDITSTGKL